MHANRSVAIAMRDGPEAGLTPIDAVLEHGESAHYDWRAGRGEVRPMLFMPAPKEATR
jgi:predicted RNA polymerase sigma factor